MHKALTLLVCLCSLTFIVMADTTENKCSLRIKKLTADTLTFLYTPQDKTDEAYFYVKAMTDSETPEKTVDAILNAGENLVGQSNTYPHSYQVPEHTKKLYVVKAKAKLEDFDPLAQVLPVVQGVETHKKRHKRNVSIFAAPLPPETKPLAGEESVNICELVL
jgi:hypothetical protein